uniref:Uncharacterized protein n=2 Tax=Oryza brachyantha TaxID=4533 RepID=J3LJA5_ORYBR
MSMCLQIRPEDANLAKAEEEEVSRSRPTAHAESSHGVELKIRERDYRTYSYVDGALVPTTMPSVDCILNCVGASSTDHFPEESIDNTLVPQDRHPWFDVWQDGPDVFVPSYWSSGGQDDPDAPESLTYRLISDMCIIDEIRLRPFEAYIQPGNPIYSSKSVRFRLGRSKLPRGSEPFLNDENLMALADENYVWTYTSPEFPMLQENVLQPFKLPRPVLCGGVVKVELLGAVQKQAADDRYYICICYAQVIGRSLWPIFMLDICDPVGYSVFKYLPGAKDLYGEDAKCHRIAG